jgi:uncharacterized protein
MCTALRLLILPVLLMASAGSDSSYELEIQKWRQDREAVVKSADGWLTVAGLFWLKEGKNPAGTGASNSIVLPKGSAPENIGVFGLSNGRVTFRAAEGAGVTVNGRAATETLLKSDDAGSPDVVRVNALSMFVIKRGNRYGVRLKDKNREALKTFAGLSYFPANEAYRIKARFVPYNPPHNIAVPNILGDVEQESCSGYAEFKLGGKVFRLEPIDSGDMLFFIFKDLTSGKETYPSGRFLFTPLPKDGEVVLDFNQAVNPPCAFTPFATCPLPPKQNTIPVRIEAGEKRYGH